MRDKNEDYGKFKKATRKITGKERTPLENKRIYKMCFICERFGYDNEVWKPLTRWMLRISWTYNESNITEHL